MKINIKVKPNSGKQEIIKISENNYLVEVKSPAKDSKANLELIKLLSRHFNVDFKKIKLKGLSSKKKTAEL